MLIRHTTTDDFSAIQKLSAHFAAHFEEPIPTLNANEVDSFFSVETPKMHARIAEIHGEAVGFISWVLLYDIHTGLKRVFLNDLCVLQEWRGNGVGEALFKHMVQWAKMQNARKVVWEVWDQNSTAISFYQKQGAMLAEQVNMYQCEL